MRKPNTECFVCKKPIYRNPRHICEYRHNYCSGKCEVELKGTAKIYKCDLCRKEFKSIYGKKPRKYCSRICANIGRKGCKYKQGFYNSSEAHLLMLRKMFNFNSCMVIGCSYNKTYDVHRLIPGKLGGKYIIGNMFAICPNHHAELHRKLIQFIKISDYQLQAIESECEHAGNAAALNTADCIGKLM